MAFVNYDIVENDNYNDEYFYFQEEAYIDALDVIDEMVQATIENEMNVVELTRTIGLIKECATEFGLACEDATAALQDFINRYEEALKEDGYGTQQFE